MLKMEAKLEGMDEVKKMFSNDLIRKTVRSSLDRTGTWWKKYVA